LESIRGGRREQSRLRAYNLRQKHSHGRVLGKKKKNGVIPKLNPGNSSGSMKGGRGCRTHHNPAGGGGASNSAKRVLVTLKRLDVSLVKIKKRRENNKKAKKKGKRREVNKIKAY